MPARLRAGKISTNARSIRGFRQDVLRFNDIADRILEYSPNVDLELAGTSNFYGGAIAKTVTMLGDFQFHVDESLLIHDLIEPPLPTLVR